MPSNHLISLGGWNDVIYLSIADQVQLHRMYRDYYEEDPEHRVPPIPTAYVKVNGGKLSYLALKYHQLNGRQSRLRPSQKLLEDIQRSLWTSMRDLEHDIASFPASDGVRGARGRVQLLEHMYWITCNRCTGLATGTGDLNRCQFYLSLWKTQEVCICSSHQLGLIMM